MRPYKKWMTRSDDHILQWLYNSPNDPIVATPGVVEANVDWSITTVRDRLRKLLAAGMVEQPYDDRPHYRITDLGIDYLEGRLKASDIPDDIGE